MSYNLAVEGALAVCSVNFGFPAKLHMDMVGTCYNRQNLTMKALQ